MTICDLFVVIVAKMAKQHASRVQQFEQRMCEQLKERQKVFEAEFVEQMHNYRALGRIPGAFFSDSIKCCAVPHKVVYFIFAYFSYS